MASLPYYDFYEKKNEIKVDKIMMFQSLPIKQICNKLSSIEL